MAELNPEHDAGVLALSALHGVKPRTRIKFCGMTRPQDVTFAAALGVDAIGMIFYEKSPRCVTMDQAAALTRVLPPFITATGLFVNADEETVVTAANMAGLSLLQFHGDETAERCRALAHSARLPWVRAIRVGATSTAADLLALQAEYRAAGASGLMLDALVEGYGGGGHVFDWSCIPRELGNRAVLGGGLHHQNVGEAVRRVRPYAVDVSSGIEALIGDSRMSSEAGGGEGTVPLATKKGIKDPSRMAAFVRAVRDADAHAGSDTDTADMATRTDADDAGKVAGLGAN